MISSMLASLALSGQLIICDTQPQIERLSHLIGYSVKSAITTVNVETKNPKACDIATLTYVTNPTIIATVREGNETYNIQEVIVFGLSVGEVGFTPIKPQRFYGLIKIEEFKA